MPNPNPGVPCPTGACCHCRYTRGNTFLNDPALVIQACEEYTGDPRFWDPAQNCGECEAEASDSPGFWRWRIKRYDTNDGGNTYVKYCSDLLENQCQEGYVVISPIDNLPLYDVLDPEWSGPPITCNTPGFECNR